MTGVNSGREHETENTVGQAENEKEIRSVSGKCNGERKERYGRK